MLPPPLEDGLDELISFLELPVVPLVPTPRPLDRPVPREDLIPPLLEDLWMAEPLLVLLSIILSFFDIFEYWPELGFFNCPV